MVLIMLGDGSKNKRWKQNFQVESVREVMRINVRIRREEMDHLAESGNANGIRHQRWPFKGQGESVQEHVHDDKEKGHKDQIN
mmetsp:Transcript_83343/g.147277  ORF Transcript_83343/g.147277 Transcript_83343/m.147277 type:complete len:83 (+) Transcript_83343:945-1193(+)